MTAQAKNLYVSPWFKKAVAYSQIQPTPWYILSAKYGLVHPDDEIEPYEKTFNKMGVYDRRLWGIEVLQNLALECPKLESVIFLAGMKYREYLMPSLSARGINIEIPMLGLRSGMQLKWLTERANYVPL